MPSTCTFTFDREFPVYFSGETITGYVSLHTTSEKNIRDAYIIFKGGAKVHWEDRRSYERNDGKNEHYIIHYSGNETYLDTETHIFGKCTLPPGTYDYTFNIPLPPECPTSCTEEYGSISYTLSLKLDRSLRFDNVFTQPLTIIKQLNLNHSPDLVVPVIAEDIKHFCFFPCSSGPVISTLTIPFGGWAPGQEIPYKLEIDNRSARYDLSGTKLVLKQIYNFTAQTPEPQERTHENILSSLDQEDRTVSPSSKRTFEGKLSIPPVPPTFMNGIITVSYLIEMNIRTGKFHTDSDIYMPITIGTIPLVQSAINHDLIIATAPSPDTPDSIDNPPSYDVLCMPPSFEEATHIGTKFKDIDTDEYQNKYIEGWVPRYPMYTNFSIPTGTSAPSAPPQDTSEDFEVIESRPLLNIGFDANTITPNDPSCSQPSSLQCPYPTAVGMPSSSSQHNCN